jgi:hypothetical protein
MMVSLVSFSALVFAIAVSLVVNRRQQRQLDHAERKGMELLLKNLSTRQREQYEAFGYFDVTGSDTGRRYRVFHGRFGNVRELGPNDRVNIGKCFLPEGDLVAGDCMLAQKIALENRESAVLKVALPF